MHPWEVIAQLESTSSRIEKSNILKTVPQTSEFWSGARLAYNALITFGVKKVPEQLGAGGKGLSWDGFQTLVESLATRKLTGHAAQQGIEVAMQEATRDQWNGWFRRILIKDFRCGITEKTINEVAPSHQTIPVFTCQLAHDGTDHPKKMIGEKLVEVKLDGVRVLTIVYPNGHVDQFSRNGKELVNFEHIKRQFALTAKGLEEAMVFDGEVMSSSFQDLMKQVHRKSDVDASDAMLHLFDMVPLADFEKGKWNKSQVERSKLLQAWYIKNQNKVQNVCILSHDTVNLSTEEGQAKFKEINARAIAGGYEGIMIKDPNAGYECKRSHAWLKVKPTITVDLSVVGVEEGTGRNEGRLGALICEGDDNGRTITVNVGSGFTDSDRDSFWTGKSNLFGRVVEVQADAVTQNQDGSFSLRFPRFVRFRGFEVGEKF